MVVDELRHILITGRNQNRSLLLTGTPSERTDHIVGLDTPHANEWQSQRPNHGMNRLNLFAQLVRHRGPISFVL